MFLVARIKLKKKKYKIIERVSGYNVRPFYICIEKIYKDEELY